MIVKNFFVFSAHFSFKLQMFNNCSSVKFIISEEGTYSASNRQDLAYNNIFVLRIFVSRFSLSDNQKQKKYEAKNF